MCSTHILVHRTPPLRGGGVHCAWSGGYNCFQGVNIPPTGWLHKPLGGCPKTQGLYRRRKEAQMVEFTSPTDTYQISCSPWTFLRVKNLIHTLYTPTRYAQHSLQGRYVSTLSVPMCVPCQHRLAGRRQHTGRAGESILVPTWSAGLASSFLFPNHGWQVHCTDAAVGRQMTAGDL